MNQSNTNNINPVLALLSSMWPHQVHPAKYLDDEAGRQRPRRAHLADDAWTKVTSLPLLLRSQMNVQINEHHPLASNTSLLYTIKYPLKPEPVTSLQCRHDSDDSVVHFFRGQFVSLSSATSFLLQNPVTKSTRGETARLYPCWHFEDVWTSDS